MKKNVMMRVAAMLLVCVMATTCGISGTFAKYVTSGNAGETARVAQWGVVITGNSDIFAKTYEKHDGTFGLTTDTVISNDLHATVNEVVAPGTSKESVNTIKITGTPEVASRINFTATVELNGWTLTSGVFYCPIIFTIKNNEGTVVANINGANYNSASDLITAIQNAVAGFNGEYFPNTVLENQPKTELTLSWSWPFYISPERDVMDTDLGDQAANGTHSTISITIDCTVTQVD